MQATRIRSVAAVAMVLLILALVVLFAITNSSASAASVGRRQTMAGAASFLIAFPTASATSTPFPGSTPAPTSTPLGVEPAIRLQAQPDSGNDIGVAVLAAFFGDPFVAYKVHVRWDPRLFRFRYLNYGAQLFARDGAVCVDPTTSADADGGGIIFGCLSTLGPVFGGGSLANIRLTAVGSGCSPLHVVTLGPPDGGDGRMGSYFVRADGLIPERGSYSDSTSDETGTGCSLSGATTPTPYTSTPTPTATVSPAASGDSALFLDGSPGEPVLDGTQRTFRTPFDSITLDRFPAANSVAFSITPGGQLVAGAYHVTMSPPTGGTLAIGTYQIDVGSSAPGLAAMHVDGLNGPRCEAARGQFVVRDILPGNGSPPSSLAASFRVTCEGGIGGSLSGEIRYHSTLPFRALTAAPAPVIYFGVPSAADATESRSVIVSNTGTSSITFGALGVIGDGASQFVVTQDGCSSAALSPSQTCEIEVSYQPASAGTALATLVLPDDTIGGERLIQLLGLALAPTPTPPSRGTVTPIPTGIALVNPGICGAVPPAPGGSGFGVPCDGGLEYDTFSGDVSLAQAADALRGGPGAIVPEDFAGVVSLSGGQLEQRSGVFAGSRTRLVVLAFVDGTAAPITFTTSAGYFSENGAETWVCDGTGRDPDSDCGGPNAPVTGRPLGPDHVVVAYLACTLETCPSLGPQHVTYTQHGVTHSTEFTVVGEPARVELVAERDTLVRGDAVNNPYFGPHCPYTNVFGIVHGSITALYAIARVFDAANNPIAGAWITWQTSDADHLAIIGNGAAQFDAPTVDGGDRGIGAATLVCATADAPLGAAFIRASITTEPGAPGIYNVPAASAVFTVIDAPTATATATATATNTPAPTATITPTATTTSTRTPTIEASSTPAAMSCSRADVNGDGRIDLRDVALEARHVFARYNARYDVNLDGRVNVRDVLFVLRCRRVFHRGKP